MDTRQKANKQKKKDRKLWPFYLAALLILGAALYFYVLPGHDSSQAPPPSNTAQEETEPSAGTADVPEHAYLPPAGFDPSSIPPYTGEAQAEINGGVPFFTEEDFKSEAFEAYGELDALGRCTGAFACIDQSLMPTEEREQITEVRPTGWQIAKYDGIDGNFLYNRCHLIAYGLTAENANENNLITGTRYMNTTGMNDIENRLIAYIRGTNHHVLYRVTPVFSGNNLVADGVLMEGASVEDEAIRFCLFAYNVQPGITIDYATGESEGPAFTGSDQTGTENAEMAQEETAGAGDDPGGDAGGTSEEFIPPADDVTYVVNIRSGKFHLPDCPSVQDMRQTNRWDATGSREELIEAGYEPCGYCKP